MEVDTFLPHLYFGESETLLPIIATLSTMPVKKYGLGLNYMVKSNKQEITKFATRKMQADWIHQGNEIFLHLQSYYREQGIKT